MERYLARKFGSRLVKSAVGFGGVVCWNNLARRIPTGLSRHVLSRAFAAAAR
jgi:hypothetical protein